MAERGDAPSGQSLELRERALGITKEATVSQVGESLFLLAWTLSALMVKVSPPSTRKARVGGYKKARVITFYKRIQWRRLGKPEISPVDQRHV